MQSYPSPSAIAAESGAPFYSSQSGQQHPVSSADELQLGAQISRGLAPIMSAGQGGPMAEGQASRAQDVVGHQYEQEQDPRRHAQMQPTHSPMDQMGSQYNSPDGSLAPRKRSKVSRACDECRRKKIRCDATGDPGDEQCSSCRRVGTRCQFSRVPMKRGPSKGYIKELADRLNTLEGAMQHGELPVPNQFMGHPNEPLRRPSDEFSPPPNTEAGQRKRTYSTISGEFGSPYQSQRPVSGWANSQPPQDQSRQLQQTSPYATPQSAQGPPQMFREADYSPNGLPPTPQWRNPPELPRQSSSFEGALPIDPAHADQNIELSDAIIDGYYNAIHPTYPILSHTSNKIRSRLSNCHPSLKLAFCEALPAAVRSLSPIQDGAPPPNLQRAAQLVTTVQFDSISTRSFSENLILLQTIMLMAIEAELHASSGHAGSSRSVWLGSAVGLAYSLKLHLRKKSEEFIENDSDTDEKLGRRLWWSLVIMDRWHASSTSSPVLIPDGSVIMYPEDQSLLGESSYQLARLSVILGHFAAAALEHTDLSSLAVPPVTIVGTLLRGELERWRESLPPTFFPSSNSPLAHICYWHLRVLMELRLPESDPHELLSAASHIVTELTHNSTLISPLTYHSAALATLTLLDLKSLDGTKDEAEKCLQALLQTRIVPPTWDEVIRELITKKLSPPTTEAQHALTTSQGLQHLAELATAETEEGRAEKEGETTISRPVQRYQELRGAVRNGYLGYVLRNGDSGL